MDDGILRSEHPRPSLEPPGAGRQGRRRLVWAAKPEPGTRGSRAGGSWGAGRAPGCRTRGQIVFWQLREGLSGRGGTWHTD